MAKDLKNKIVAITGGAEGIGFEIAKYFLKNGAKHVIILDINEVLGKKAATTLKTEYGNGAVDFVKCDVRKDLEKVFKTLVDKYKTIDVLVNNAAIADETEVRKTIETNVISVMEWTTKFWEHMRIDKGGKGGTIINMGSLISFRPTPFLSFYKGSKHAIISFTKTIGHEDNFNRFGVRIMAICPGFTRTKLVDIKIPDPQTLEAYEKSKVSPEVIGQDADAVGKAAVDVFQRAASGTVWMVEGGQPIRQLTDESVRDL